MTYNPGHYVAEDRRERVARVRVVIGPQPILYTLEMADGRHGQAYEAHLRPALPIEIQKYKEQRAYRSLFERF